jgi:hypothetical protein
MIQPRVGLLALPVQTKVRSTQRTQKPALAACVFLLTETGYGQVEGAGILRHPSPERTASITSW